MRPVAAAVSLAVAVSLALAGCTSNDSLATAYNSSNATGNYVSPDGTTKTIAPADRGSAVTFSGATDAGGRVSSVDYAGKVVVLNFWYASCPPCRLEAPDLEKLNQKYSAKGVVFLGVNVEDTAPTALSFEKSHGISYPSILDADEGAVRLAFHGKISPNAVPTTLIIDEKGRVAARFSGLITSPSLVGTIIEATMAEGS
ncbi:TlpA family protein disulfide reductase [Lysinimonas soli]|uniref:TlpA family protein disulfide reductase n=1 Tax=Lysinimonas soli TaxID=1074233 RepID=A0ABW0NPT1_9MICO